MAMMTAILVLMIVSLLATVGYFRANREVIDSAGAVQIGLGLTEADQGIAWGRAYLESNGGIPTGGGAAVDLRPQINATVTPAALSYEEPAPDTSDEITSFGSGAPPKYTSFELTSSSQRSVGLLFGGSGKTRQATIVSEFLLLVDD